MKKSKKLPIIGRAGLFAPLLALLALPASAAGFEDSVFATGTSQLLSDISAWLIGICLTAGALGAVYCLIRRALSDEADGKMWTRRCIICVICAVAGALIGGIIALIGSYYV